MPDVIRGSTNVYADLGYDNADEMLVKARLITKIAEIIAMQGWTQQQAADAIGLPRPKLSNMLNGQFRGISEAKLMHCLTRLGRDIQIVVGPEKKPGVTGNVQVVTSA